MTELSSSSWRPLAADPAAVVAQAEKGLYNVGLIKPGTKIISRFHKSLKFGYPTPFLHRDKICNPLFKALDQKGIKSRGRFGAWKYEVPMVCAITRLECVLPEEKMFVRHDHNTGNEVFFLQQDPEHLVCKCGESQLAKRVKIS